MFAPSFPPCLRVLAAVSLVLFLTTGCTTPQEEATPDASSSTVEPQDALDKGIVAHGGLERWQSFGALEYDVARGDMQQNHLIDLYSRRTRQASETFTLGYDGTDVWVAPNLEAFRGNPRFFIGLDFYFFALPFVLADPGTKREDLGRVTVNGVVYDAVKISYDDGVGESPDDYYIPHFDPETGQMRLLLYTVTFRSQEPNENYGARMYEEWQTVEGLVVPKTVVSYRWDSEQYQLGDRRGETVYNNVSFSTEQPDDTVFAPPAESETVPATPASDS